jgi:hypothetical protein
MRVDNFLDILLLYVVKFVPDELSHLHENFVLNLVFQENFTIRIIVSLIFLATFRAHKSGFLGLVSQILSKKCSDISPILCVSK